MKHVARLALTGLMLAAGCATPRSPFPAVELTPVAPGQAQALRQAVEASLPQRFTVLQSVVFEFRGRSLSAIGLTRVDPVRRSFSVAAVTPVGLKLFEIAGREGQVRTAFVAPGIEEHGDPVETIAKDIQRVYFDRVPDENAAVEHRGQMFRFESSSPQGRLEHWIGGSPPVLLKKQFSDARGGVWSASYHLYTEVDDALHPGGIVFSHHRYGYRLILRLMDVRQSLPASAGRNVPLP